MGVETAVIGVLVLNCIPELTRHSLQEPACMIRIYVLKENIFHRKPTLKFISIFIQKSETLLKKKLQIVMAQLILKLDASLEYIVLLIHVSVDCIKLSFKIISRIEYLKVFKKTVKDKLLIYIHS